MSETLMVSVSGVRGLVGTDLTPEFIARYAAAFGHLARTDSGSSVVLARDARTSGPMFAAAASAGLQSVGCRVIDCGMVPTPTAQLAVEHHRAGGGIVITASHNPVEWNALKFIGPDGLFLDRASGERLRAAAENGVITRTSWDEIGTLVNDPGAVQRHLDGILSLPELDVERIRARGFRIALDCVRGAGGAIVPALLDALGCRVDGIHLESDGRFPRPPEPVPEHLDELGALVRQRGADLGMAVDPDVDRLALTDERGVPIGEDYTLAFAVRAVLGDRVGPVVANLSTSLVVEDAARDFGVQLDRAPVGEANVARAMREKGAVVGGEGNGGVILPSLHLGRDAPVAAGLVLSLLAGGNATVSEIVQSHPRYCIVKAKAPRGGALDALYEALRGRFADARHDTHDGLRVAWADRWLHVRPSGTEPIVRYIAEAPSEAEADALVAAARDAAHE